MIVISALEVIMVGTMLDSCGVSGDFWINWSAEWVCGGDEPTLGNFIEETLWIFGGFW